MTGALDTRPRVRRMSFLGVALACLLASGGIWINGVRRERATGRELAAQFLQNALPGKFQNRRQIHTAKALLQTSTEARAAFLRSLLEDGAPDSELRDHEHELAIALSQVRTTEARALYRKAILPAIETSLDAAALRMCFSLMNRWDTAQALPDRELAELGSVLEARLLNETSGERLEALANGLSLASAQSRFLVSQDFPSQLLRRIRTEKDEEARTALFSALLAMEPRLQPRQADTLASQAISLMNGALDSTTFAAWGAVLKALKPRLDPAKSTQLMDTVLTRLVAEPNPEVLRILASVAAAPGALPDSKGVSKWAGMLVDGISQQIGPQRQSAMLTAFTPLAANISQEQASSLSLRLLQRLEIEFMPDGSAIVAEALGALGNAVPAEVAGRAAARLVEQMKTARDSQEIARFAGALKTLPPGVPASRYQEAARMVAVRLTAGISGQDATMLVTALESVAVHAPRQTVPEFTGLLARRIAGETNPGVQLWLAKGIVDLGPKMEAAAAGPLAATLARQLPGEPSAVGLRALCFALGALPAAATSADRNQAAAIVGQRMQQTNDAGALKDLTAALLALDTETGQGAHDDDNEDLGREEIRADVALKLATRILLERDATVLQDLAASLAALRPEHDDDAPSSHDGDPRKIDNTQDAKEGSSAAWRKSAQPAVRALIERILAAPDAASMGTLAPALRPLSEALEADEAAELAVPLIARIEREPAPEVRKSLGEILTAWPDGGLHKADLAKLAPMFDGKNAPCAVVLRVAKAERQAAIVPQLLNPACAEAAWIMQAAELGKLIQRKLVRGLLGGAEDDDADEFHQMIVSEDEDDLVEEGAVAAVHVDFNQLSDALDATRSPAASMWTGQWPSVSLALIGLVLLAMGTRARNSAA